MEKLNKDLILDVLSRNKGKLRSFGVKRLALFGSFAQGTQSEESDIDFIVEFEEGKDKKVDNYLDLMFFLEDVFGKKVDLVKPELVKNSLKPFILEGVKFEATI